MVEIGVQAAQQVEELRDHYDAKGRPEAATHLAASIRRAAQRIELAPDAGLLAPRPYPALAQQGRRWIKEGRYWFLYSLTTPPVILSVFYDQADMPRRVRC